MQVCTRVYILGTIFTQLDEAWFSLLKDSSRCYLLLKRQSTMHLSVLGILKYFSAMYETRLKSGFIRTKWNKQLTIAKIGFQLTTDRAKISDRNRELSHSSTEGFRSDTRERDFLRGKRTKNTTLCVCVCVYLSPSLNHERVPLTRCTYFVYALLSCRPVNENGTRSNSHEGQDEIKDRRCRSRDNDPRVLTEDDRGGIVHLSSVSIKRLGSSTARKPERGSTARRRARKRNDAFLCVHSLLLSCLLTPLYASQRTNEWYKSTWKVLKFQFAETKIDKYRCEYSHASYREKSITDRCIAINAIASRTDCTDCE